MITSLAELLPRSARRYGGKTALVVDERRFSYDELDALSSHLSAALAELGIRPDDRVTLYLPNGWQWIVSYFAIHKLGAVANPVNALLTADETVHILKDCRATALITDGAGADGILKLTDRPALTLICTDGAVRDGVIAFDGLLAGAPRQYNAEPGSGVELSTICYTSGTTGYPKGAMLSHQAVLMNAAMTAVMHSRHSEDVIVSALPLPHVYGNIVMNSAFMVGATLVLHCKFESAKVLTSIEQHRATILEGVPTMYMYLLAEPLLATTDISSLRYCTVGGQTMAPAKMQACEEAFGCPLIELWGMTELGGLGLTFAAMGPRRHGSAGVPLPYMQARIVDVDDGLCVLKTEEIGELVVRGPMQMLGYYNNERATREVVDEEGWLHTGDIGRMDADGYVHVLDRKKDMIITAGYNIYPAELERVILEHPEVLMAAVGATADDTKGELAKAYIVRKAGAKLGETEILTFCRTRLAAYKVPRAVCFVNDLPKTSTGKILRRKLKELETEVRV